MIGRFKFFEGPDGASTGRASVLVKIIADTGTYGWGQSVPIPKWSYESLESVTVTLKNYLIPGLIGLDATDIEQAHRVMNEAIAGSFSTGMPMAKAAIDLALYDLKGRLTASCLSSVLGRTRRPDITLSWTLNPKRLDDVEGLIQEGWERGYRHFNVKVAPDPDFDFELCRMVKNLVPDGFLWADANGGYDLSTALSAAPRLADIGVAVLEQPLPANRLTGYRDLKRQGALPIVMDEGVVSSVDLEEFIRLDLLDGVALKPARSGGIWPTVQQIEILRETGLMILASGLTDPDVSLAASLGVFGAYDYDLPAALNGPQFISESLLRDPFVPENGLLRVPDGPGLGVEIDEGRLMDLGVEAGL
jgi:L-alanine-DL-glutamate epimerase-like enolase superfamily enzyme